MIKRATRLRFYRSVQFDFQEDYRLLRPSAVRTGYGILRPLPKSHLDQNAQARLSTGVPTNEAGVCIGPHAKK